MALTFVSLDITMTSQWGRWRFRSSALRSFTQAFIQAKIKETSKLRVTGLCEGNSPVPGEFTAQRVSNAENISIWWRHHGHSGFSSTIYVNTWKPAQNGRHFTGVFGCVFFFEDYCVLIYLLKVIFVQHTTASAQAGSNICNALSHWLRPCLTTDI